MGFSRMPWRSLTSALPKEGDLLTKLPESGRSDLREIIANAVAAGRGSLESKGAGVLWRDLIIAPLAELDGHLQKPGIRLIVIIDALDECGGKDTIEDLLRILGSVKDQERRRVQLRFLVTSRPERKVEEAFAKLSKTQYRKVELEKIKLDPDSGDDITMFLRDEIAHIAAAHVGDASWPGEENIRKLSAMTEGLFIYAATCCRFLDHYRAEKRMRDIFGGKGK